MPTQLTEAAGLIADGFVPSLVILSLGGNNLSFTEFARDCLLISCPEIGDIKPTLAVMTEELTAIYQQIDLLVNSPELTTQRGSAAQILVTDYPLLIHPEFRLAIGSMQVEIGATAQIAEIQLALNAAIAKAVANSDNQRITLVSVQDAFIGHQLGDTLSFVSITLHPNARGYEALLTRIAAAADQLSAGAG